MRHAHVRTEHEDAALVAASLRPDNTDSMATTVDGDYVDTEIGRETTGGLHATVDDYLVSLTVAETVAQTADTYRNHE